MVPSLLCLAAHLRHPALGSLSHVSLVDNSSSRHPHRCETERVIILTIFNTVYSSKFNFERALWLRSGPSVQHAPPEKSVVYEIMSISSPPWSWSRCFCPTTLSKEFYKMALGFLFPHNLCMWNSIMGSFITRAAPLRIQRSFRLSFQLLSTLGDSFCRFCEKSVL